LPAQASSLLGHSLHSSDAICNKNEIASPEHPPPQASLLLGPYPAICHDARALCGPIVMTRSVGGGVRCGMDSIQPSVDRGD
jgi:hypothetical protein